MHSLGVDAMKLLDEILSERFERYFGENKKEEAKKITKPTEIFLQLSHCFEDLGEKFSPRMREDFPSFLRCIFSLLRFNPKKKIFGLLLNLLHQFTNTKLWSSLVSFDAWLLSAGKWEFVKNTQKKMLLSSNQKKKKNEFLKNNISVDPPTAPPLGHQIDLVEILPCDEEKITPQLRYEFALPLFQILSDNFHENSSEIGALLGIPPKECEHTAEILFEIFSILHVQAHFSKSVIFKHGKTLSD
jgi:hypothetical protein